MAPVVRDVGDPKPESEETLLAALPIPRPRPRGKTSRRSAARPGLRGRIGAPGPWQLGSGEREGSGERSSESRLCTCALPAAAASLAVRACGVRPDSSPAWDSEHGGRTRLGRGARERKASSAGVPSPRPAD